MKIYATIVLAVMSMLVIGCAPRHKESQDAEARRNWANETNWNFPIKHVSISAEGAERTTLEITVLYEVAPYEADDTAWMLADEDLKADAKAQGFTQIHVKGGRASFTSPDTINRIFTLR